MHERMSAHTNLILNSFPFKSFIYLVVRESSCIELWIYVEWRMCGGWCMCGRMGGGIPSVSIVTLTRSQVFLVHLSFIISFYVVFHLTLLHIYMCGRTIE